jgi:hypothetical protein
MLAEFSARSSQHRFGVPRYCIRHVAAVCTDLPDQAEWLVMQRLPAFGCAIHPM